MLEVQLTDSIGSLELEASLTARAGEAVAVTGRSGSGKTTLLRAIAGLRHPASGSVRCDGVTWFDSATAEWVRVEERRVGMVFQEYALFPRMSAAANVAYPLAGMPRGERTRLANEALERVGLAERATHRPGSLSGGERQRLALARAIVRRPSLLLLDEPLASLDRATADSALDLIAATVESLAVPCLLVTHDREVIERCSAAVVVADGLASPAADTA